MHIIDAETRRFGRLLHYAGVLATVVCATAGYSLLYAPMKQRIAEKSERIQELTLSVRNASVAREQHAKVSEQLRGVRQRIAEVQRRVPHDADAGEFLKQLTQLAAAEKLAIRDFQPEKPESRGGYAEMRVTLKGSGSYASICTFVDRLSKLQRLSKIKDLSVSAGDNTSEYPMTATLVIYFGLQGMDAAVVRGSPDPAQSGAVRRPASTQGLQGMDVNAAEEARRG